MRLLLDSVRVAADALRGNPLRTVLTTGGIVVGIFFVLVMGWVLDGLDRSFTESFSIFGDDIVYLDRFDWSGSVSWEEQRNRRPISAVQYRQFRDRLGEQAWVVPTATRPAGRVVAGTLVATDVTLFGTTSDYIDMHAGTMQKGRFFSAEDDHTAAFAAVLGSSVAEQLFPRGGAIGGRIRIDGMTYRVVGVLPKRGTILVDFLDQMIYVPISRYRARYGIPSLTISIRPYAGEDLEDLREEAVGHLRAVRSLGPHEPNDFGVNSQQMFAEFIDATRAVVWGIGLFLTGLAFVVGAIGIMNIMFVSVTERTREIGIRKAVGGSRTAILLQFLVEAVVLSLLGAAIGLGFAAAVVWFRQGVAGVVVSLLHTIGLAEPETSVDLGFLSATIPLEQVGVAVVVAGLVGVGAGIIPAFRASRLTPVDALRAD